MKKIFFCSIILLLAYSSNAQNATSIGGNNIKKVSVADANALNGVAQPTINGMPYSQYKAQQDALKNKVAAKQETGPSLQLTAINAEDLQNLRKEEKQQAATTAPVTAAKSAAAPVKSTQTQVAKPATSKQGSGN